MTKKVKKIEIWIKTTLPQRVFHPSCFPWVPQESFSPRDLLILFFFLFFFLFFVTEPPQEFFNPTMGLMHLMEVFT